METKEQFNKVQMTPEELAAWAEKKQDQRETVNGLADRQLYEVFSDPQELDAHLKRQATFGKMGVTNVLLISAQNVEATDVRTFDEWKERGRSIAKGEKAIAILAPKGEYTREDGTTRPNFEIKNVFDVKQTRGKELHSRPYPPAKAVIKAMLTKAPVPIVWSDKVKDARYDSSTNQVEANREMDADQLLYSVMREYAIADGANEFTAQCVGAITCYRYSMMPEPIRYDPASYREKDSRELKGLLNSAKELSCNYCDHIDKNLQKMRERKQEER
jgi:hypothetical protein